MKRRTLVGCGAALLAGTVAGCLTRYDLPGGDGTTTRRPTLTDRSFSMTDAGCGTRTEEATVEFDDGTVVVTGTTTGADACHVAELVTATVSDGDLRIVVGTRREGGVCAQCLTELDYEARLSFDGGLPRSVTVVHRSRGTSRTVATGRPTA